MKIHLLKYLLIIAPVFYQLDYRQRSDVEVSILGLGGFAVKKSFETRYRPFKKSAPISEQEMSQLRLDSNDLRPKTLSTSKISL